MLSSLQAEVRDEETDVQIDPPCIWLIQAPYADDIRYPTVDECQSAVDIEGVSDHFQSPAKRYDCRNTDMICVNIDDHRR